MLSLLNNAFDPSVSYPDKLTYMTSVHYLQSIRGEPNTQAIIEKIKGLLASKNTRLQGLQFLEIALEQNPDVFLKGRWTLVLYEIINEPVSSILKEHVCKIFCILIPLFSKEGNQLELQKFAATLFPNLLAEIEREVEWIESAGMCLLACLKYFPQALEPHRDRLLSVIYKQMSRCVSPKTFEVFADCFCCLPNCHRLENPNLYAELWTSQYLTTLNTMQYLLNTFLTFLPEDPYANNSIPDVGVFPFVHEEVTDIYPTYMKGVRRFLNLSKCLAKMLSTKNKFPVQVPIKLTLECMSRLFHAQEFAKINPATPELQLIVSSLSQMQIASFVVLESLILNFNLVPYSYLICEMMIFGLQSSNLSNFSKETISPIRYAVWSFLDQWVSLHGAKVAYDLVNEKLPFLDELLKDIEIVTPDHQTNSSDKCQASTSKSNKNIASNPERKPFVNKSKQAVCKKALKTLENLLYSGANFFSKVSLQEISKKIKHICIAVTPQHDFPLLYDDHMCRKLLYSVLLALAVVTKIDDIEPIQYTIGIFKRALTDPSTKVVRVCHKAMAMCRLYLHPRKPMPPIKDYDTKTRRAATITDSRFTEWNTEEYIPNLPPVENVSNVSENASSRIAHAYQNPNEGEITPEEYMQQDAHYSELASENQCNGDDILEMPNCSPCQDDDSDEDGDADEEDAEEQSCIDEEMNQEAEMPDNLYIPSTSRIQVINSVSVASDTDQNAEEQDYEELRPSGKSEDKNSSLNGVGNNVIDEEMSSPSTQNMTSENGVYDGYDEEDKDQDEDDEDGRAMYPGEKRVPEHLEASSSKKQKIEEAKSEEPVEKERARTPTLEEMKADLVCDYDDEES